MDLTSRAIETVAGHNVLDLILWLAGVIAFLVACELVNETVQWARRYRGKPSPPRHSRDAKNPPVVTGQAANVGDVR